MTKILNNLLDIAEAFNGHYTNAAPLLDTNNPPSHESPLRFLRGDYSTSMAVPTIHPQDVISIINSLHNEKRQYT